jgi:hypothetical protein
MTIRAPARPLSSPLNILDGTVIGRSVRRYRRQEFIHFLNALERGVASGKSSATWSATTPLTTAN